MRTEAQSTVSHWTSVQLDPETKNPHSPQWNSVGECCVKLRVLTRKPADQIAVSKLHQTFLSRPITPYPRATRVALSLVISPPSHEGAPAHRTE